MPPGGPKHVRRASRARSCPEKPYGFPGPGHAAANVECAGAVRSAVAAKQRFWSVLRSGPCPKAFSLRFYSGGLPARIPFPVDRSFLKSDDRKSDRGCTLEKGRRRTDREKDCGCFASYPFL